MVLTVVVGIYLLWLLVGAPGPAFAELIGDGLFVLLGSAAVGMAWRAATGSIHPRARRAWQLVSFAYLVYTASSVAWFVLRVLMDVRTFPSVADVGYVAYYPLLLAGLLAFPRTRLTRAERLRYVLDSATVLLGGGMVVWEFVLGRAALASGAGALETAVTLAYPLGDLLIVFGAASLILRPPVGIGRTSIGALVAALMANTVANLIYGNLSLAGSFASGGWSDALWATASLGLALAAYWHVTDNARGSAAVPRRVRSFSPLPYAAAALGYAAMIIEASDEWGNPLGALVLGAAALTAVVAIRQIVASHENARLLQDQATHRGEARYRSLGQHASDLTTVVDVGGIVQYQSPSLELLAGFEAEALVGRPLVELAHLDDAPNMRAIFAHLSAEPHRRAHFEWRLAQPDGSWMVLETTASNMIDDPYVAGLVLYSSDITQRKRSEEALQEAEERFRGLIAAAFDGFAIHQDRRILEASQQFAALFGYEPAELVGRSVLELTAPEWRDVVLQNIAADPGELHEGVGLRKDDSRFYVELVDRACSYEGRPARVIVMRDVTSRKQAEEHRSRMAAIVTSSSDAIVGLAGRAIVTDWNAGAERLYGYSAEEMVGRSIECLIPPECGDQLAQVRKRLNRGERIQTFETQRLRKDGTRVDVSISISAVVDTAGRIIGAATVARDVTERKHLEEQLRRQALYDELTGLPNRTLLQDRLSQAVLAAHRENTPMSLLLVDLDRFKEINDTFGHHYGDLLLQQIGPRLSGVLRDSDTVARLGGDEFGILLPTTDAATAVPIAEKLLRMLEVPFEIDGQTVEIGASIGVAGYPEHGSDAATLLRRADVAMYVAKRGESGIVVYTAEQDHYTAERLALGGELRRALENNELLLHFQPKLDMRDGTLVGVEALVRWQHPLRGFLPPSEFIQLAEQTGLIMPLTRWVLEAALRQQQAWHAVGMELPVAVNLSRRTLQDPELPGMIAQLLARYAVPPRALVLEITESSLMADPLRAAENLSQLRALGVQLSIDDFGTGYSSLDSLKNLPVDELKIDQSFVQAMATDASARAIVRAIIDLADALQLRVVAEGVEDHATWDVLAGLGCDVAQGYFLSRPIAATELEAWITDVSQSWLDIAEQSRVTDALQERIRGRGARLTAEEEFIARKQAEAALRASEERNRLALQAAGMGTWDVDIVGDVHAWSVETEALFGLAPGTFEGTYAALRRAVHPDDWPAFEDEVLASQAEHRDSIATYRAVWADGSVHWLEEKGRSLYAADGTLVRMTGTTMDITDRKRAEVALQASEERFRKQYKGIPVPTYSWLHLGDDFVLQDYNDAAEANTEGDVADLLGSRASERFADQPQNLADLHACLTQQRTIRREVHHRYQSTRQQRHLAFTYVFVPPQTVMVHREDITEAKQAEQQREAMAQSEKLRALGQMASGIAHDLNQSLMLVASYSDLARQALVQVQPNLVEVQDLLTTTTQAALDGGETVKRLLRFTRAAPELESQHVDLSTVIVDAARLTAPRWRDAAQAEGRAISLQVEAQGHPMIQGSFAQLRDLMTNLIFNAVDALPTGGTIHLRVLAENEQGIIEVADSGVGMSPEVQERVFEPFFTTKGEGGTGLGLAMVFGLVEQHGGHIDLRSAPGEGTTFRISFPLVERLADADATRTPVAQADPLHPLRVLAVDDEPMMTKAMERMLRPSGHLVSVAGSGEEALEKLAEETFDVVVSDMGMGDGMNGWDLADAVKLRWPNIRFMLATGWGAAIDPGEARARGVETVLAKPYHPTELLQALSRTNAAA
jgi:diguanylate cyclase (GGDEF)-like protein/PAS domain S-box-containing protein